MISKVEGCFWMKSTFFKPQQLGWLAASFSIGIACWVIISVLLRGNSDAIEQLLLAGNSATDREVDLSVPRPELEPSQVVTMQVNSIRDAVTDISKLKICYSLASPGNRKFTGPFNRFSELVMLPPYDRLATCVDWQMGSTFVDKNLAAVLVSTISDQGQVSGFRFVLQRQDFPRSECWLTEAVQFISDESIRPDAIPMMELDRKVD